MRCVTNVLSEVDERNVLSEVGEQNVLSALVDLHEQQSGLDVLNERGVLYKGL